MQRFRVDPRSFLGLAMPNQYSQTVRKQISSWFWGDNFGPKSPNLHDPYNSTTVLYDKCIQQTNIQKQAYIKTHNKRNKYKIKSRNLSNIFKI